jgi:hypothetical protein
VKGTEISSSFFPPPSLKLFLNCSKTSVFLPYKYTLLATYRVSVARDFYDLDFDSCSARRGEGRLLCFAMDLGASEAWRYGRLLSVGSSSLGGSI